MKRLALSILMLEKLGKYFVFSFFIQKLKRFSLGVFAARRKYKNINDNNTLFAVRLNPV